MSRHPSEEQIMDSINFMCSYGLFGLSCQAERAGVELLELNLKDLYPTVQHLVVVKDSMMEG